MGEPAEPDAGQGVAVGVPVGAEDFGLKGPRGWAFRGVGFGAEAGSLVAVEGPSGSGRTCLLLALTGRMRPSEGHATVGSLRLPKRMAAVRRISALAHVPGVTDLDPALTVGEHLRERALLRRRFDGSLRGLLRPRAERAAEAEDRVEAALSAAGLDLEALPKGARTAVRDLDRLEAVRLSVALALVGRPRLLGVDDIDLKLSDAERAEVWALLKSLTGSGITIVAVCSEAPEGAVVVSTAPAGAPRAREDAHEAPEPDSDPDSGPDADPDRAPHGDEGDSDEDVNDKAVVDKDKDKETADALAQARRA
ncbi:ATP-binding cassette domain-containing protein [Streptomyces sp. NPDC012510]|uniref:ATP-binding cassette domain-containing protein n=1 Tax=Streptomyces sp. NPDC012510 TaxID=3364838 RepID=UPI0036E959DD